MGLEPFGCGREPKRKQMNPKIKKIKASMICFSYAITCTTCMYVYIEYIDTHMKDKFCVYHMIYIFA